MCVLLAWLVMPLSACCVCVTWCFVCAVGGGDAVVRQLVGVHWGHQPHDVTAEAWGGHSVLP